MTLEETIYWIVMIFFALPIALGALLYIWRTFVSMIFPGRYHSADENDYLQDVTEDEYWKTPDKDSRHED